MSGVVVGISAGHGGNIHRVGCAGGAACSACGTKAGVEHGIVEAEYVARLAGMLHRAIGGAVWNMPYDWRVEALNHVGETIKPIDRARRADALGCNIVLCLHVNESDSNSRGAHMLHRVNDGRAIEVATAIALNWPDELKRDLHGSRRQGRYVAGMVEPAVRAMWPRAHSLLESYSGIPTVLVECFYASRRSDCIAALNPANKLEMVAALMTGIAEAGRICAR